LAAAAADGAVYKTVNKKVLINSKKCKYHYTMARGFLASLLLLTVVIKFRKNNLIF